MHCALAVIAHKLRFFAAPDSQAIDYADVGFTPRGAKNSPTPPVEKSWRLTTFSPAIAEIAGVFVGFGALISVTRRTKFGACQIGRIRAVVTIGLLVIIAALIPVVLRSYGFSDNNLWFISSSSFLILNIAVIILSLLRSENRVLLAAQSRANPLTAAFFWLLLEIPVQVPLILILVGSWQDLEPAFYSTALVFNLFEAAYVLAQLVYAQEISTKP